MVKPNTEDAQRRQSCAITNDSFTLQYDADDALHQSSQYRNTSRDNTAELLNSLKVPFDVLYGTKSYCGVGWKRRRQSE